MFSNPVEIRVVPKQAVGFAPSFRWQWAEDFVIDLDTGETLHNTSLHQQPKERVNQFDLEWDDDANGSIIR